jgi:hypothetical protein
MNPKHEGLCDVFGNFGAVSAGKSDGWHSDIEEILAAFEEQGAGTCEIAR